MTPFALRAAVDADWPTAWAIQRAAFLDLVTRTHGGWTEAEVRRCAEAWDPATTRVVEVDGAAVGWVRLARRADHDWLDVIVVDPSRQGAGLGTSLLRRLIDEAVARGVPLCLSVYRTNPARRLYRRLGFEETPRDELRVHLRFPPVGASGIHRGDLFWVVDPRAPDHGAVPHPHVVVQDDLFNASRIDTVVVCALTTRLGRAKEPGNVLLDEGEGDLPQRSVVIASQVSSVPKASLGPWIGRLAPARVDEVLAGLRFLQASGR